MSKPTAEELSKLRGAGRDDERYHVYFDALLEAKLAELDPEWLEGMREEYDKSGNARWCA